MDYKEWALKLVKYGGWRNVVGVLYLEHDYKLSEEEAKDIIDNLYKQNILLKKYEFRCPHCRDTNVCFENEVGNDITCGECDNDFPTALKDRINYYFKFNMKHEIFTDFFKK